MCNEFIERGLAQRIGVAVVVDKESFMGSIENHGTDPSLKLDVADAGMDSSRDVMASMS
jgi:hypothetical protein